LVPLPAHIIEPILRFHRESRFATRGAVVTDLDGTAVHESEGRIAVAAPVTEGLKALADLGRPVVLNTLRFPLNVVQTFGHAWSAITADPVPLVSLNGSVLGVLRPTEAGETTFDPVVSFPLAPEMVDGAAVALRDMLAEGIDDIVVFHYPPDWRLGETVWTPHAERVAALKAKYVSASRVVSSAPDAFGETLRSEGVCMLSILVDLPEDRRMAYQHANPNRFLTAPGIDKLSGAREAAERFGFDLLDSVGAGDTAMDRFLSGVGLAFQVGPRPLADCGQRATVRLRDPLELGAALFALAELQRETVQ
jgi:hydroxymethylpyrimidine pyrophosphatase-like HAD family hydrolase